MLVSQRRPVASRELHEESEQHIGVHTVPGAWSKRPDDKSNKFETYLFQGPRGAEFSLALQGSWVSINHPLGGRGFGCVAWICRNVVSAPCSGQGTCQGRKDAVGRPTSEDLKMVRLFEAFDQGGVGLSGTPS